MEFLLVSLLIVVCLGPGAWFAYIAITGNRGLKRSTEVVQAGLEWFTFGGVARKGFKKPTEDVTKFLRACCSVGACSFLILFALGVYGILVTDRHSTFSSSGPSLSQSTYTSASGLSHSTQQKIYYDMIATQDQNPDSPAWDEAVKEAAADYYNVPMSTINEIVREGARNGWLQPDPP